MADLAERVQSALAGRTRWSASWGAAGWPWCSWPGIRLREGWPDSEVAVRRSDVLQCLTALNLLELSRPVLRRAAEPFSTPLGALDAIHLATAIAWREPEPTGRVFATHDAALGLGAKAMGFEVIGL